MESFSFQSLSSCQTGHRHHSKWKMFIFHWNSWDGFELVSSLDTSLPRFPFHEILLSLLGKWLSPSPSTLNKAAQVSALHLFLLNSGYIAATQLWQTFIWQVQRNVKEEMTKKLPSPGSSIWTWYFPYLFVKYYKYPSLPEMIFTVCISSVHPLVGFGYSQHIKALI